ncbi:hypothetical protein SESBI_07193 [Sesbania bispinosa]|nr:hypothetical protein SESBI_07193 [Sesbania bispinosa]
MQNEEHKVIKREEERGRDHTQSLTSFTLSAMDYIHGRSKSSVYSIKVRENKMLFDPLNRKGSNRKWPTNLTTLTEIPAN